jgi:hypothetical protein
MNLAALQTQCFEHAATLVSALATEKGPTTSQFKIY